MCVCGTSPRRWGAHVVARLWRQARNWSSARCRHERSPRPHNLVTSSMRSSLRAQRVLCSSALAARCTVHTSWWPARWRSGRPSRPSGRRAARGQSGSPARRVKRLGAVVVIESSTGPGPARVNEDARGSWRSRPNGARRASTRRARGC